MARRKSMKLSTPLEVRRALSRVANMLLNDEIESKAANSIILACNAILGCIRTDEQQKKIDELERLLESPRTDDDLSRSLKELAEELESDDVDGFGTQNKQTPGMSPFADM